MRAAIQMLVLAAGLVLGASDLGAQSRYQVIVNEANPVASLSTRDLARIFRKELSRWPGGQTAAPVDQRGESATRAAFSTSVLGKSVGKIEEYWRQELFSGRAVPPAQKATDAEVIEFVRTNPGAVGYVGKDTQVGAGVRVVPIGG